MKVKVANRLYKMSDKEYNGILTIAKEQVPFGVYAVEKKDYAELRLDQCNSVTRLKELIRGYKAQGFKVHFNRR